MISTWVSIFKIYLHFLTPFHDRDKLTSVSNFLGFNIYLHDKGQFVPGLEMGKFVGSMSSLFKVTSWLLDGHHVPNFWSRASSAAQNINHISAQ